MVPFVLVYIKLKFYTVHQNTSLIRRVQFETDGSQYTIYTHSTSKVLTDYVYLSHHYPRVYSSHNNV